MKKPNIDLSKQGMKQFFLHHIEKVIFGVAIVLLGLFFWLGFGTKTFSEQTPKGLAQLSDRAHAKMVNTTSWTEIEEFRQADKDAHSRIESLEKVVIAPKEYKYEPLLGTKAMTAGLRLDPAILKAEHLMAYSFPATVLLTKKGGSDAVTDLPYAGADDEDDDALSGGSGIGAGGGAGLEGDQPTEREKPAKKERDDGKFRPGSEVAEFQFQEMPGIRPLKVGASTSDSKAWMCNVVVVAGIVRFEDQSAEFASAFAGARAYYPKRDRPVYQYLQVERMKEGDDDWEDITDKIDNIQVDRFITTAPEVVDPQFYDTVLTSAIPTITQVDYRDFASWPLFDDDLPDGFKAPQDGFTKIPLRDVLVYPKDSNESTEGNNEEESLDPLSRGSKGGAKKDKPDRDRPGGRPGGGGRRPPSGADRGRPSGESTANLGDRLGDNPELYEKAMDSTDSRGVLRLVRFFDVQPVLSLDAEPEKYKYRVRLWLRDANNEPEGGFEKLESNKRGGTRGGGIGAGGGAGLEGGEGGAPPKKGESNEQEEEEDTSVWVAVTDLMKAPSVRERITRDKARQLPQDRDDLSNSIVSEWSDPTEWVTVGDSQADKFYAGKISPPKSTRIGNDYLGVGESVANIATVTWNPDFGTRVPANREAHRADVLTFNANAHLLHPVDWSVRLVEEAEIATDAIVVDIMGGDELRGLSSSRSPIKYSLPGEVLVMDSDGSLHVQNDIADKQDYFHLMIQEDETAQYGKKKTKKTNDRSRRPPGGGNRGNNRGGGGSG